MKPQLGGVPPARLFREGQLDVVGPQVWPLHARSRPQSDRWFLQN